MDTMLVVGRVGFVVDLIDQTSVHLDQSGTENSPFIVKIQPTPKTQAEADQETKDRLEKTAYDWNILFLNALLVSVAFPQFIAISIQAIFLWLAFRATKKSADVAEASLVKLERAFVLPKEFFVRWHWHLNSEPVLFLENQTDLREFWEHTDHRSGHQFKLGSLDEPLPSDSLFP